MATKVIKCYHCDNIIETDEYAIKPVPLTCKDGRKRDYKRKFHLECVSQFKTNREDIELSKAEDDEWHELYMYVKNDILGQKANLSRHCVLRLKGLYLSRYIPNGNNVKGLPERGYAYSTILLTFKAFSNQIKQYLAVTNFADDKHMIDGMMLFVTNNIQIIQRGLDRMSKVESSLEKASTNIVDKDYEKLYQEGREKREDTSKKSDANSSFDFESIFREVNL